MNFIESIILGLIQGLTEFIPVSSSGHLDLIPRLLGWENPTTAFILFLHIGTLLSLLIYFRKLIFRYISVLIKLVKRKNLKRKDERDLKVIKNVLLSIIPAVLIGFLLEGVISGFYDSNNNIEIVMLAVAVPMILIGILFLLETKIFKNNNLELKDLSSKKAFGIGLIQAVAFIRGVSRSGITLLGGQALGLKRVDAAEFSFLMSIPIITGTSLYSIYEFIKLPQQQIQDEIGLAFVGMIVSFISGLFAVNFLLKFLKTNSLKVFGIYRIIFGLIIIFVIFRN